jgi:undecaprenyl-diphosphatase
LSPLHAALLGILEGLTEFLPVSSTGHLVLLGDRLGHDDRAAKTLEIVIQLGAVLAVVVYYREVLTALARGVLRREPERLRLLGALAIAFAPAAGLGLVLHRTIKELLFAPGPIAIALIAGGIAMIGIDGWSRKLALATSSADAGLADVTPKRALVIGLAQCLSLWPGTSRSMTTILGGQLAGLRTSTAAEFSFLLSIPVLGAATLLDLVKDGDALLEAEGGMAALASGLLAAFVVSLVVISAFLRFLKRFGLAPFGIYRIALGAAVLLSTST